MSRSAGKDVIVVGLGAMGSAAAYHLASRGHRVAGLDRFRPPHRQGSSHGRSRAIRQAYFEDPAYVPLVLRAYELWERLEADSGRELLQRTGCLMLGGEDSEVVSGSLASAREHDLPHRLLDAAELGRHYPQMEPEAGTVGLLEEEGGVLGPEDCIEVHLELASRVGADLRFDEAVQGWRATGEGVEVRTARNRLRADALVMTAGPWVPDLLATAGGTGGTWSRSLRPRRTVMTWIEPRGGVGPWLPERFPVWVWDLGDGRPISYGFPALEGTGGGVKVGLHSGGEPTDAETVDRKTHPADHDALMGGLVGFPDLVDGESLRDCVCLYTDTPDGHFLLAPVPETPQVLVAAGFSGHGFKFAGVVGEILADLVEEGSTEHPISLFSPDRAGFRAPFRG